MHQGLGFGGFQQPGAAPDHLPELGVGVDRLGKDQVDDLAHVDAGIEHVHTDGDAGHVVVGELVEQAALAVDARVIGNQHLGQLAFVLRDRACQRSLRCAGHGPWRSRKRWSCRAARRCRP